MGFTIYITKNDDKAPDMNVRRDICEEVERILGRSDRVCVEFDEPNEKPEVDEYVIRFNGKGELGHETFYFDFESSEWSVCKTSRKPYTQDVIAVLAVISEHAPGWLSVDSDGGELDFSHWALLEKWCRENIDGYEKNSLDLC
jgi:hypothetical protein